MKQEERTKQDEAGEERQDEEGQDERRPALCPVCSGACGDKGWVGGQRTSGGSTLRVV